MGTKKTNDFLSDYLHYYEELIREKLTEPKYQQLTNYAYSLMERMVRLSKQKTTSDFWATFAEVIKIDSQLHVLAFHLERLETTGFDIEEIEVIAMIEKDAATFFSENMGYALNQNPKSSLLFLIAH